MKAYDKDTSLCAGIVLYNPDLTHLCENIDAIILQVEQIILVDNHSQEISRIVETVNRLYYHCVSWILNDSNKGIAFTLNQIMNEAHHLGFEWVITLDQDSICCDNMADTLAATAKTDSSIAMVSPYVVDVNLITLSTYKKLNLPKTENVTMCITSGCLTSVSAVRSLGGFNNALFIDQVDHDMCLRLWREGYKVVRDNQVYILHEIGKSREFYLLPKLAKATGNKWLSRPKYISNHTPIRVYYQTRNLFYMLRAYPGCMGVSNFKYLSGYCRGFVLKLIMEPQRMHKLAAFLGGVIAGLKMNINLERKIDVSEQN